MPSPLEKYDNDNEARWEVLQDIPVWEEGRVLRWIEGVLKHRQINEWGNAVAGFNPVVLPTIQRRERVIFSSLGIVITNWSTVEISLRRLLESNPERFVLFLETLVKYVRDSADLDGKVAYMDSKLYSSDLLTLLDKFLSNGSRWRIVFDENSRAGLAERASEELTEIAKKLANSDLSEAWGYVYGTETNPKQAIEKAQNAIEYFATKAGLTKATTSVYGVLLGDIKTRPGQYESAAMNQFKEQDENHKGENPDGTLNDMMSNWFWYTMNLVQKVNVVRHKTNENHDYVIPVAAARQAVLMATLLCEMIEKEYFKRSKK